MHNNNDAIVLIENTTITVVYTMSNNNNYTVILCTAPVCQSALPLHVTLNQRTHLIVTSLPLINAGLMIVILLLK